MSEYICSSKVSPPTQLPWVFFDVSIKEKQVDPSRIELFVYIIPKNTKEILFCTVEKYISQLGNLSISKDAFPLNY